MAVTWNQDAARLRQYLQTLDAVLRLEIDDERTVQGLKMLRAEIARALNNLF